MNMKKLIIILSLFLSLSMGQECDGLTEVELWGEWYDISTVGLYLQNQGLTGSIPPEIGCLTNLTLLQLSDNQLTGGIPPEIGNLTNLTILALFNNQLTGEIPPEVCDLIDSNALTAWFILDGNNLINTCIDCAGEWGGAAIVDDCGVCDGDNSYMDECGVCFGWGEISHCRDLDGDGWGTSEFTFTTCDIEGDIWVTNCDDIDDSIYCESNVVDCAGILCGDGIGDECGVCAGDNSTCLDECGEPNGDNSTCLDECGVPNGNGMEDFYADWDGDGFGDCSGEVYTYCPNEAESWMSSECDSLGDINGDGVINILDIVIMVNMILDGEYDSIADINEDDTVDILDIVTLVNWILNNDSVDCNGVIDGLSFIDSCGNCIESLPASWKIEIIPELVPMITDLDTLVDFTSNFLGADILYTDEFDGLEVDIIEPPFFGFNSTLSFSFYHGDWDVVVVGQQYYYFTQDIRNHNYNDFLNDGKTWNAELRSINNWSNGTAKLTFNFIEGLSDADIIVNVIGSNLAGTSYSINDGDSIDGIIMTYNTIVYFDIQISNLCY